jgi:hypothetical protein
MHQSYTAKAKEGKAKKRWTTKGNHDVTGGWGHWLEADGHRWMAAGCGWGIVKALGSLFIEIIPYDDRVLVFWCQTNWRSGRLFWGLFYFLWKLFTPVPSRAVRVASSESRSELTSISHSIVGRSRSNLNPFRCLTVIFVTHSRLWLGGSYQKLNIHFLPQY